MKIRSATPNHRSISARLTLVGLALLLGLSVPIAMVQRVAADRFDDQISALNAKAKEYQAQANALRAKGDTLQNKLDGIKAQIAALQTQIKVNEAKRDKLQIKIKENKTKLATAQDALGGILANLYVDNDVSAVEMLASSQTISDFVDKQEYRSSVKDQLNSLISEVKKVKAQLESDKKEVDEILKKLTAQQNEIDAQRAVQQNLVNQTRGEEAAYQKLVNKTKDQMEAAAAAQRAYFASLGGGNSGTSGSFQYWGWSGNQGCGGGGYPYCAGALDYGIDPWGLYTRECVSYVAWALSAKFHKYVGNFSGHGMAYEWPWSGPQYSGAYRVNSPQRGDAVVLPATSNGFAPVGHLMIVESVSGSNVFVSQYNFGGTGMYSTMWIKKSGVVFLRFQDA